MSTNYFAFYISACLMLLLSSCQSDSRESFQRSGKQLTSRMAELLSGVDSRQACLERESELESLYLQYAALIVRAEAFLKKHPMDLSDDDSVSEVLRRELLRVYEIDGCREIVERAQREAIHHLNKKLV